MTDRTVAELERDGWEKNAADYDEINSPITDKAIPSLLDAVGELKGRRLLEVACGTGRLAHVASSRGAFVTGIDVAENMVKLCEQANIPKAEFRVCGAESLPFEDESFDVAVCNFGLLHFSNPVAALSEVRRTLKAERPFACSVWEPPDEGNEFFGNILGLYGAHANMDVGLPEAPPTFAFADSTHRDSVFREAGLQIIDDFRLDLTWPLAGPETALNFVMKGAVRMRLLFERQTQGTQTLLKEKLVELTKPYLSNNLEGIPCPAHIAVAKKIN